MSLVAIFPSHSERAQISVLCFPKCQIWFLRKLRHFRGEASTSDVTHLGHLNHPDNHFLNNDSREDVLFIYRAQMPKKVGSHRLKHSPLCLRPSQTIFILSLMGPLRRSTDAFDMCAISSNIKSGSPSATWHDLRSSGRGSNSRVCPSHDWEQNPSRMNRLWSNTSSCWDFLLKRNRQHHPVRKKISKG